MTELTYISASQFSNLLTPNSVTFFKKCIVDTLVRWGYIYNSDNHVYDSLNFLEKWIKKEGTNIDLLYCNSFQFELCKNEDGGYELKMYAIGRYRRHGSSCDLYEHIFCSLEYQLKHPNIVFNKMDDAAQAIDLENLIDFNKPDEDEDEDEDEAEDEEDDSVASLEEERIMSMPLRSMTDVQIEKFVELIGRCPRDECNEWSMDYTSGDIFRFSYVNFANKTIEDQDVSNITITRANFAGCTLRNCVFDHVHFDECDFKSIILENVTFKNSSFTDCDIEPYMTFDNSCTVENCCCDTEDIV